MRRSLFFWEAIGIPFIFLAGFGLHYAWDFFHRWWPIGIFAPINESLWEHLKLVFWPALLYGLLELMILRVAFSRILLAKGVSLLFMLPALIVFHKLYRLLTKDPVVLLDIFFFLVTVTIGQWISWRVLQQRKMPTALSCISGGFLLIVMAIMTYIALKAPYLSFFLG